MLSLNGGPRMSGTLGSILSRGVQKWFLSMLYLRRGEDIEAEPPVPVRGRRFPSSNRAGTIARRPFLRGYASRLASTRFFASKKEPSLFPIQ